MVIVEINIAGRRWKISFINLGYYKWLHGLLLMGGEVIQYGNRYSGVTTLLASEIYRYACLTYKCTNPMQWILFQLFQWCSVTNKFYSVSSFKGKRNLHIHWRKNKQYLAGFIPFPFRVAEALQGASSCLPNLRCERSPWTIPIASAFYHEERGILLWSADKYPILLKWSLVYFMEYIVNWIFILHTFRLMYQQSGDY